MWCFITYIFQNTFIIYKSDKNFRLKLCAKGDFLSYLIATHIFLLSKDLFFYKNFILRWWKSATKYFARTDYNLHYNVHTLKKYLCVKKVRIEFCWESERKLNESCQKNFFCWSSWTVKVLQYLAQHLIGFQNQSQVGRVMP